MTVTGSPASGTGPLTGIRVIEFGGIGPAPFAAMLLADLGATVLRIDHGGPKALEGGRVDFLGRGRPTLWLDLKKADDLARCRTALESADALIEGFRPGVMERLGLGPEAVLQLNSRLVYARVTGWGQEGPLARRAGHDINYIALAGALNTIGPRDGAPIPPLNLVGDFGGGGMLLAFGLVSALLEARSSGRGQVVDAAMVDGTALLMAHTLALRASGAWPGPRGSNTLDGGAHFYRCYRCADGQWLAVGAIESRFYQELLSRLGVDDPDFGEQWDRSRWSMLAQRLAGIFASRPRDHWVAIFEGSDACVTPVLGWNELVAHPHNAARSTFTDRGNGPEPSPAPRFSRTPATVREADLEETLKAFGL